MRRRNLVVYREPGSTSLLKLWGYGGIPGPGGSQRTQEDETSLLVCAKVPSYGDREEFGEVAELSGLVDDCCLWETKVLLVARGQLQLSVRWHTGNGQIADIWWTRRVRRSPGLA